MLRYVLAWIPMVLIGVVNGMIREATYGKTLSELHAHQVSTAVGVLLLGLYIGLLTRLWGFQSFAQALTVGCIWFGLTVAFEFLFGHYVAGHSWSRLLSDYNLLAGRVWLIILLWVAIAPLLFYRLFSRSL